MLGVNKVILIGNLGRDPEIKKTPSGTSVATITMATTERRSGKNGERQDVTEWHSVVLWGKLAELAGQYLKKGRTIYIEGRLATRSWDDKDGSKRYKTEIIASQMQFIGTGGSAQGSGQNSSAANYQADNSFHSDNPSSFPEPADTFVEDDLPF